MFVKHLTVITSPSKFVLAHKRGDSFRGTCLRDKRVEQHKCSGWHLCPGLQKTAARLNLGKRIVFWHSQKTIGTVNVSEECNRCSFMCRCGCSAHYVNCHPQVPQARRQKRAPVRLWSSARAQQCDSNSITMMPAIINGAAGNIGICSAQADKALLSMQAVPRRFQQLLRMFESLGSLGSV